MSVTGTATYNFPSSPGGNPTLRTFDMTRTGSVDIQAGNFDGPCAVSLQTTWVAAQGQFSTTGTVCGQPVTSNAAPRGGLGQQNRMYREI